MHFIFQMDTRLSCPLCHEPIGDERPFSKLSEKGCQGIRLASKHHATNVTVSPGDMVHVSCRKDFTRPGPYKSLEDKPEKQLRSLAPTVDFKSRCLFCDTLAKCGVSNRKRSFDTYPVRSLEFQSTLVKHCKQRGDQWAQDVERRLSHVIDLPAADAIYHQQCNVNFRTGKGIPKAYQTGDSVTSSLKSPGRPEDSEQKQAFKNVITFLENTSCETLTVNDLVFEMQRVCGEKAYTTKHMKQKVIEHFGNGVVISSIDGRRDIITLKTNAASIIHSFYEDSQGKTEKEKKTKILETAAKLLKCDINSINMAKDHYPDFNHISSKQKNVAFLPDSLQMFLKAVIGQSNDIKVS